MTSVSDLNGLFKQTYGDSVNDLIPESSIITKSVKFVTNEQKNGSYFNVPCVVQLEQGISYANSGAGLFALNAPSSMVMQNAQILGSQIAIKAVLDTETAQRATSKGKSSFESATKLQVANVLKSHGKRLELVHLYGGTDLGTVDSSNNVDTTHTRLVFTTASWSDAMWSGMTAAAVSLFKTTDGSILNANAPVIVTKVDVTNKTLYVSGNSTDIAAIDTWVGTAGGQQAAINFYSARLTGNVYNESYGIDKILTYSGSIFGIDNSVYDLWKGNTYSAGGAALTQSKLDAAVAIAVGRGLSGEVSALVNPKTWSNLNSDQAAKRVYDTSYDKNDVENGAKAITYYSQNGIINVISHPYVKEGDAFLVNFDDCVRPGSTEVTFDIPGQAGGEIFTSLENYMGFQYRSYSSQALLINSPATAVKITGIVNT